MFYLTISSPTQRQSNNAVLVGLLLVTKFVHLSALDQMSMLQEFGTSFHILALCVYCELKYALEVFFIQVSALSIATIEPDILSCLASTQQFIYSHCFDFK